jgi:hypothetical protein
MWLPTFEFEKQTQALNVQIQDWKGKLEMAKVQMNKPTLVPPVKMDNILKESEKLSLDNTLFKCRIKLWGIRNPSENMVVDSSRVCKKANPREHGVG